MSEPLRTLVVRTGSSTQSKRQNYDAKVQAAGEAFVAKYGKGTVAHMVIKHDSWCRIHDAQDCNCEPDVEARRHYRYNCATCREMGSL